MANADQDVNSDSELNTPELIGREGVRVRTTEEKVSDLQDGVTLLTDLHVELLSRVEDLQDQVSKLKPKTGILLGGKTKVEGE